MSFDFKSFWEGTPRVIDRSLALGCCLLCLGGGIAIGRSGKVAVNADGVLIEQQAIATQKDLEYALFLVKSLQGIIERYEKDASEFSRRYKAGEELAELAQFAAEFVPEQQIEELEQRVEQSKVLLEGDP